METTFLPTRISSRSVLVSLASLATVIALLSACTVPTFEYSAAPVSYAAEKQAVFGAVGAYALEERRQPRGLFADPRFELLSENLERGVLSFAARPNATITYNVDVTISQTGPSVVQVEMVSFLTTSGPNIPIRDNGTGQRFIARLQEYLGQEFRRL